MGFVTVILVIGGLYNMVSQFIYVHPKYENKEDDRTTRAGPRVSAVLCSLTLMTLLSSTFFAFLYSCIVCLPKHPNGAHLQW